MPTGNNIEPSTDNRLFGTVVTYNCPLGYYVNPGSPARYNSLTIECLDTKVWNFTAIPDCERKRSAGFSEYSVVVVAANSNSSDIFVLCCTSSYSYYWLRYYAFQHDSVIVIFQC